VRDLQRRDGVLQFRLEGKGEKVRYVPVGMKALRLITEYLEVAGHKEDLEGPLFRPVQNRVTGELNKPLLAPSKARDLGSGGEVYEIGHCFPVGAGHLTQVPPEQSLASSSVASPRAVSQGAVRSRG
jgi:hypothetical protein